jgi:diguanylate cyclase (GGDEF)-like protein/PAS domain S-box-containing protein
MSLLRTNPAVPQPAPSPARIVALYATVAGLWILFSDLLVSRLLNSSVAITHAQSFKGWVYVAVTSVLLYALIQQHTRTLRRSEGVLRKLARARRVLGEVNRSLMHTEDEPTLLREVCQIVVDAGGYPLAWIGLAQNDPERSVKPLAWAGRGSAYLSDLRVTWEGELAQGPTGRAVRSGETQIVRDMGSDEHYRPWRQRALEHGFASSLAVPLREAGATYGALSIYASERDAFDHDEMALLEEMAGDLAYGLAALRAQAARREAERRLRESEQRYALAAEGANDGLWDWDVSTGEVYFSPRWSAMLGWPVKEVGNDIGQWMEQVHPEDVEALRAKIENHLRGATPHFEAEYRMRHHDGTYRWMLCRGVARRGPDGTALRMAGSQTDITVRKLADAELERRALVDSLTGLRNRAVFLDRLDQALQRAGTGSSATFGVLCIDLDRFKVLNDSLGPDQGDRLLAEVGHRLAEASNPADTVARLGGDEFGILLERVEDAEGAIRTAEQFQRVISGPIVLDGREISLTGSIGIALQQPSHTRAEAVLRDAELAMYRAKGSGLGRCALFDPELHRRAVAALELEMDLRGAVASGGLSVHYQPIVSLETNRLAGFEALARWYHARKGQDIPPSEFIPVAEDTELIVLLGRRILLEACKQLQQWRSGCPDPQCWVSVNVSGKQLAHADFARDIAAILEQTGLPPRSLKLEITESVLMRDVNTAARTLQELADLGVTLAVDDFGTGYSSLASLSRFPISALKVDRSFVSRMDADVHDREIVKAIVNLADSLGIAVIAEGVETVEQRAMLHSLGCGLAQGFVFSRPLEPGAAGALLTSHRQW